MAGAVDAYYADLARWVRAHEAQLYRATPRGTRFATDLHHLYYFLLRCEALGLNAGDLDQVVGPPLVPTGTQAPAYARTLASDLQSLFSVQDSLNTVQTLWSGAPAKQRDPDDAYRYLFRVCSRLPAMDVYAMPRKYLEGYEDMPGENGVPVRALTGLRDLSLQDVEPRRVLGWDRLSVQLETLRCTHMHVADLTEVFLGLVERDAHGVVPSAAWHALRVLQLAHNELTFVPASALTRFSSLVHLDLSHNLLNSVPPALAELPHLRALNLSDNLIDSVLGIYDCLPAVRSLNLASNRLESLCGLVRLTTLEQVDLRHNAVVEPGEVGRLATLPHISHVWIAENPMTSVVPDVRVACFTLFALERREVCLDDAPAGFFERRRVAERLAHQVATVPQRPDTAIEAQVSSRVRRVTLAPSSPAHTETPERRRRPRRTDPGPGPQPPAAAERPRKPRRSELPSPMQRGTPGVPEAPPGLPRSESLKQRIEQLRGDAGDDWLRQFARRTYDDGAKRDDSTYPVHAAYEAAPADAFPTPVRLVLATISTPVGAALTTGAALVGGRLLYVRYLRRYATVNDLTPRVLKMRRTLVGRVTSVGDADGFRFYHTPGLPLLRNYLHPVPTSKAALRNQTISVRLAGADAPEAAHFGREAQPFADEAKEELKRLVEGKTVWLDVAHIDQYQRLVATPYVFRWPYVFGRTNVSLAMVRKGLATVYRNAGAAYGAPTFLQRTLLHAKSGRRALERAEEYAKLMRLGMWSHGRNIETPAEYKRRMRE